MNKAAIRAAVEARMAQKGYPPGWYWWPELGRGGRLYVLVEPDAPSGTEGIKVYRLPAPMPVYKFRAAMRAIPRHGPPRQMRPRLTADSWAQPSFEAMWSGGGATIRRVERGRNGPPAAISGSVAIQGRGN